MTDPFENDSSGDRYRKLKKQEADTEKTQAEKRFEQLKEEAKQEFVERQEEREQREQEDDETGDAKFVTY